MESFGSVIPLREESNSNCGKTGHTPPAGYRYKYCYKENTQIELKIIDGVGHFIGFFPDLGVIQKALENKETNVKKIESLMENEEVTVRLLFLRRMMWSAFFGAAVILYLCYPVAFDAAGQADVRLLRYNHLFCLALTALFYRWEQSMKRDISLIVERTAFALVYLKDIWFFYRIAQYSVGRAVLAGCLELLYFLFSDWLFRTFDRQACEKEE